MTNQTHYTKPAFYLQANTSDMADQYPGKAVMNKEHPAHKPGVYYTPDGNRIIIVDDNSPGIKIPPRR